MRILDGIALRAAALLALILPTIPAAAKQPPVRVLTQDEATAQCGPIDDVLGALKEKYGEHVLWWGDTDDGVTMLITQRPDTRTWTLLAVHGGVACMVGSGGSMGAQGS